MIRIAIVEDDDDTRKELEAQLQHYAHSKGLLFSIAMYGNGLVFLSDIKESFDIVFMDIAMPNLNGMEVAKKLRERDERAVLVFVTNMAQFAIKGYEVDACDFILKPVDFNLLSTKMTKILRCVSANKKIQDTILLHYYDQVRNVCVADIRYVEVRGHLMMVHLEHEIIEVRKTMSSLEKELKSFGCFFRIGIGYLVNGFYVTAVDEYICYVGNDALPISRSRKKSFMKDLTVFLGN